MKDTIKLYITDAGKFLASPREWSRKEYGDFAAFLFIVAICFAIDQAVRSFFLSIHSPLADMIFSIGNFYGKGYVQLACFLALLVFGFKSNRYLFTYLHMLLESIIFSGILVNILKIVFGRWRPFTGQGNLYFTPMVLLSDTGHVSLPSADTALAFSTSLVMAEMYENKAWKALWYLLGILSALGRIYHDKHWTSDVVISIFLCYYTVKWLKETEYA